MERPQGPSIGWLLVGIFVAPLILESSYLGLSRWPVRSFTVASDWTATVLSLAVGVICIAKCPLPMTSRVVLSVIYVFFAGWFLLFYDLFFVCVLFNDCL